MTALSMKQNEKKVPQLVMLFTALLFIAVTIWFFFPFMGVICLSALMAHVFFPVYKFLSSKMPQTPAAWIALAINFAAVVIPVVYVVTIVVQQGVMAANVLSNLDISSGSQFGQAVEKISSIGRSIGLPVEDGALLSSSGIADFIKVTLPNIVRFGAQALITIAANMPTLVTSVIIYAFLFNAFLRYNVQIKKFIINISPYSTKVTQLYLKNAGAMVTASIRGQLVISFVTALLSALSLIFLGYQNYFWLLLILFTIIGMIPLGSGVVVIPICLFSMLLGNFWVGFWVLMFYLLVICNIDSILRPKLIPKEMGIVPAFAILATFCGIYYFGIMGVVYGPLIAILLLTTSQVLIESKKATR